VSTIPTGVETSCRGDSSGIVSPAFEAGTNPSASRMALAYLMGQASGAVLPRLDGVPVEYQLSAEDPRAIRLAQTLTVLGIADPGAWDEAKHSPAGYVQAALKRWLALHGGERAREHFALNVMISGNPDLYCGEEGRQEWLYLMVDPYSAGYMVLGPTLEMLERIHPRLPATFYHLFVGGVQRVVRVYDFRDAQDRVEMLKEWAEGEPDQEQYEFPDVEGCIPPSMKLKPLSVGHVKRIADSADDQVCRQLLRAALDLSNVSRRLRCPEISEETREALMDSNSPLPALLVSFKPHDSVCACWDDESQAFLEACPEPNLLVEINPSDHASVRRAFNVLAVLCETMAAASRIMALLPDNDQET
jgi:hypothetical protein